MKTKRLGGVLIINLFMLSLTSVQPAHADLKDWWNKTKEKTAEVLGKSSSGEPIDLPEIEELADQAEYKALVLSTQHELERIGYPVSVDGVYGPQTKSAIQDFQDRMNMARTGQPSRDLLVALETYSALTVAEEAVTSPEDVAKSAPKNQSTTASEKDNVEHAGSKESVKSNDTVTEKSKTNPEWNSSENSAPSNYDQRMVQRIQQGLHNLGYETGSTSGVFSGLTAQAIEDYESDNGLPVTGIPTKELVALIRKSVAALRLGASAHGVDPPEIARTDAAALPPSKKFESTSKKAAPTPKKLVPTGTLTPSSQDFIDHLLAPEGIRVGMSMKDARAKLDTRGYKMRNAGFCDFELEGSSASGYTRIKLDSFKQPESYLIITSIKGCPNDDTVVIEVVYTQYGKHVEKPVEPEVELIRIAQQYGEYDHCPGARPILNHCIWRGVDADRNIGELSVQIKRSPIRTVKITGDLLVVLPDINERTSNVQSMEMQALHLCENYGANRGAGEDTFRALFDCNCIAKKMGQGYSKGLVGEPTASNMSKYRSLCPASREKLLVYFENSCMKSLGVRKENEAWARGGGCVCIGQRATDDFIAEPISSYSGLGRAVSNNASACNWGKGAAAVAEYADKGVSPALSAANESSRVVENDLFKPPSGIRPLRSDMKDGRLIVRLDRSATDKLGGNSAITRVINLLLLQRDPSLLKVDGAARMYAAENLADAERAQLMKGCDTAALVYCEWTGNDVFEERDSKEKFLSSYAGQLSVVDVDLPIELVVVESVKLGKYSTELGGLPVSLVGKRGNMLKTGSWGVNSRVAERPVSLKRDVSILPEIWQLSPALAETVVRGQSDQYRSVRIVWTYRVTGIEPVAKAQHRPAGYALNTQTLSAKLYKDALLTEMLAELPLGEAGSVQPTTLKNIMPQSESPGPTAVVRNPARLERAIQFREGGSYNRMRGDADIINLLLLKHNPKMIGEVSGAIGMSNDTVLAHQNFVGLTASDKTWSGANEFERLRAKKAFTDIYAPQLIDLAPDLPIDSILVLTPKLSQYDFDRAGFPITWNEREVKGDSVRLHAHEGPILNGIVRIDLSKGTLPTFWPMEPDDARAIVQRVNEKKNWGSTKIPAFVEIKARLVSLESLSDGSKVFVGETQGIDVSVGNSMSPIPIGTWEDSLGLHRD
ncbi:MAG: peptidoglycan-binding domain-containing protein [Halioglobus sp.]